MSLISFPDLVAKLSHGFSYLQDYCITGAVGVSGIFYKRGVELNSAGSHSMVVDCST